MKLFTKKPAKALESVTTQLLNNRLNGLSVDKNGSITMSQEDKMVIENFYNKRSSLERNFFIDKISPYLTSFLILYGLFGFGIPFLLSAPFMGWIMGIFFGVSGMILCLIIMANFAILPEMPIFNICLEDRRIRKINQVITARYEKDVASWMQNSYNIKLTGKHLKSATKIIAFSQDATSKSFTDENTGEMFTFAKKNVYTFITTCDDVVVQPGFSDNLLRANSGEEQMEAIEFSQEQLPLKMKTIFNNVNEKIVFLRTLQLNTEKAYIVEHAEKESATLVRSLSMLNKFQKKTLSATAVGTLAVLEKELDNVIEEAKEDIENNIKIQNFYVNSREKSSLLHDKR